MTGTLSLVYSVTKAFRHGYFGVFPMKLQLRSFCNIMPYPKFLRQKEVCFMICTLRVEYFHKVLQVGTSLVFGIAFCHSQILINVLQLGAVVIRFAL